MGKRLVMLSLSKLNDDYNQRNVFISRMLSKEDYLKENEFFRKKELIEMAWIETCYDLEISNSSRNLVQIGSK